MHQEELLFVIPERHGDIYEVPAGHQTKNQQTNRPLVNRRHPTRMSHDVTIQIEDKRHEATPIRKDIQCLRAVAVILVVLYHLGAPYFTGGFIGVDIFLVISGYLVVGSVLKDHLTPKRPIFSFPGFLIRRSRRLLLPSAVCLGTILIAMTLFPSVDFEGSRESIAYSAFSLANVHFYAHSTAYFATDLGHTLTLHYWSLGLEEQFFFIFPLIIMGFCWFYHRRYNIYPSPKTHTVFLGTMAVISFLGCFVVSDNAKFFLVPFRVWEFLVGALAWLYERYSPNPRFFAPKNPALQKPFSLSICGILVFFSTFMSGESYPNMWTLVVVSVSALFILSGNKDLDLPVLEHIGNLSYSIYLYHWPIIRFINLSFVHHKMLFKDTIYYSTNLFLTQCATWLSYHYIENPSKQLEWKGRTWLVVFLALACSISFATTLVPPVQTPAPVIVPQGQNITIPVATAPVPVAPIRFEDDERRVAKLIENQRASKVWEFTHPLYEKGKQKIWVKGRPDRCVLLVGDSHAMMYNPALQYFAKNHNLTLWVDTEPAVSTLPNGWRQYFVRDQFPFVPEEFAQCKHKMVFMASVSGYHNWTSYHDSLDYMLQFGCLVQMITIYYPDIEPVPCIIDGKIKEKTVNLEECVNTQANTPWELSEDHVPKKDNLHLLSILDQLCPKVPCKVYQDEIPKYKDAAHLTRIYVEYLAPLIDERMSEYPCVKNVINR